MPTNPRRVAVDALTMREMRARKSYLRYSFALVLKNASELNVHMKIIEFLHKAGLCLALLDNDMTTDNIIVLVSMEPLHDMLDARHRAVTLPNTHSTSNSADPGPQDSLATPAKGQGSSGAEKGLAGAGDGAVESKGDDGSQLQQLPPGVIVDAADTVTRGGTTRHPGAGVGGVHRFPGTNDLSEVEQRMLHRENQLRFMEQYLKFGIIDGHPPPDAGVSLNKAAKVTLTYRAISRVLDAVTFELGNSPDFAGATSWEFVEDLFPLHDERWNRKFLRKYMRSILDPLSWLPGPIRRFFAHRMGYVTEFGATGRSQLDSSMNSLQLQRGAAGSAAPAPGQFERHYSDSSMSVEDTDSESDDDDAAGKVSWLGQSPNEWADEEIREHMGERAGFYFAFLTHYTTWLTLLALVLAVWYVVVRFADWGSFNRGLSVLGFCVPAIWAPLMLRTWKRRSEVLEEKWGTNDIPDEDHPNVLAEFDLVEADADTGELRRRYDPTNNRLKLRLALFPMVALNVAVLLVTVGAFAQLYTFVRMAPTCECCEWHRRVGSQNNNATVAATLPATCEYLAPQIYIADPAPEKCEESVNCFATADAPLTSVRGVLLAIVGAALGTALHVFVEVCVRLARRLTNMEHWPTDEEHKSRLHSRQFSMMMLNVFFFFVLFAFVYVPFGASIQQLLRDINFDGLVPMYGWVEGQVSFDELVIFPIVFCQLANLLLETVLPMVKVRHVKAPPRVDIVPTVHRNPSGSTVVDSPAVPRNGRAGAGDNGGEPGAAHLGGASSAGPKSDSHVRAAEDAGVSPLVGGGVRSGMNDSWNSSIGNGSGDYSPAPRGPGPASRVRVDVEVHQAVPGQLVSPGDYAGAHHDAKQMPGGAPMRAGGFSDVLESAYSDDDEEEDDDEFDDEYTVQEKHKHARTHLLSRGLWARKKIPVKVLDYVDDPNHYDAASVLDQANLDEFHPGDEYLDMIKQFGLVAMLSVAWAWAPLTAVVNNVFETRFDAFKMMRAMRRPVPRRDEGIREWEAIWVRACYAAMPVAAGLITIATGQLEWWSFGVCHQGQTEDRMTSDPNCFDNWAYRVLAFVVLERLGHVLIGVVMDLVPAVPDWLQQRRDVASLKRRQAMQDMLMRRLPTGTEATLRYLFESFDADGNGTLSKQELADMLDVIVASPLSTPQMRMFLTLIDVDDSSTITFTEFTTAVRHCQTDFVLKDVLRSDDLARATKRLARGVREEAFPAGGVFGTNSGLSEPEQRRIAMQMRDYIHGDDEAAKAATLKLRRRERSSRDVLATPAASRDRTTKGAAGTSQHAVAIAKVPDTAEDDGASDGGEDRGAPRALVDGAPSVDAGSSAQEVAPVAVDVGSATAGAAGASDARGAGRRVDVPVSVHDADDDDSAVIESGDGAAAPGEAATNSGGHAVVGASAELDVDAGDAREAQQATDATAAAAETGEARSDAHAGFPVGGDNDGASAGGGAEHAAGGGGGIAVDAEPPASGASRTGSTADSDGPDASDPSSTQGDIPVLGADSHPGPGENRPSSTATDPESDALADAASAGASSEAEVADVVASAEATLREISPAAADSADVRSLSSAGGNSVTG